MKTDGNDSKPFERPEVLAFAKLMERVLRKNDHKGGWQGCSASLLFSRLKDEVSELDDVLSLYDGDKDFRKLLSSSDFAKTFRGFIAKKAADVANFAMMIADNFGDMDTQ